MIIFGVCTPPLPCWKPGIGNVFSTHHTAPAGVLGTSKCLVNLEEHLQGQWFWTDNTIKVQVKKLKAGQFLPRLGKSHCLLWQMPATCLVTKWKNKGLGAKHKNVLYTLLASTYLCSPPHPTKRGEGEKIGKLSFWLSFLYVNTLFDIVYPM